jgi:cyclophilin family peptidyl-prolyl cis-trans isomerase
VLLAEDRRDSTDAALGIARAHDDPRIRTLAERALGRIRDPRFAARESLPPIAPAPVWPEPAWRLRFRALTPRSTCAELLAAMEDESWPVRGRAADLAVPRCAEDNAMGRHLRSWLTTLPLGRTPRPADGITWHAAARALEQLALVDPSVVRSELPRFAAHPQPEVRRAAARAAARLADTARLADLARDADPNVREAAIDGLAATAGHAADTTYIAALDAREAQVVRAAARALKGSSRGDVAPRALAAWERWVAIGNASAHDARIALLEVAGRPATDDRPPSIRATLPPDAIALALGTDIRIRVTMAPEGGGGSFVVRLRGDVAPMMAARILALVREGYYDGLTWHRVEHDFVIQGGSPFANEYAGHPTFLRDELGTVPHPRGTVGMSTRGHDTGDAQWFVNLRDNGRLTRDYTVFAEVTQGIEVIDGILEGDAILTMRVEPRR